MSKLTELMQGSIDLTSEQGKGSNFYFILPLFKDGIDVTKIEKEKEETDITRQYKGHVLIVEDNKTNQILLKMLLDDRAITATIADDRELGVKAYQEGNYDLIFMDENMPNLNAIEATKQIKQLDKFKKTPIPIIAVTANALNGDKDRFLAAGLDNYIAKPIMDKELDQVLSKYLIKD